MDSSAPGGIGGRQASVQVHRLIRAPRERVFQAWIDPALRKQWWAAEAGMYCDLCEIDPVVGGQFRVGMATGGSSSQSFVSKGAFVEIDPPQKLVFTWRWEHAEITQDSLVSIEFHACEHQGRPATELILTHDKLVTPFERSEHQGGWIGCLKSLGLYLAESPSAPGSVEQTLEIDVAPEKVYEAITTQAGIAGWWTADSRVEEAEGGRIELGFGEGSMAMEILNLSPLSHVRWRCVEQNTACDPSLTKPDEWVGTALIFRLTALGENRTRLHFVNDGLTPQCECYDHCQKGWEHFLASLKAYCQTGVGTPFEPEAGCEPADARTRT